MHQKILVSGIAMFALSVSVLAQEETQGQEPVLNETIQQPVYYEELAYPPLAQQARIQGIVVVRAKLDSDGKVMSAETISGPKLLIPVCLSNIMKWQFPSKSANPVVILYDFRLEGYCVSPPCRSLFTFRPRNVAVITAGSPLVDHGPSW